MRWILVIGLLLLTGCGMGWGLYPKISNGMTNNEVDTACIRDCFPVFKIVNVGMVGDELHEVYHQDSMNGPGQFLFVTYKNGVMTHYSYSGF